MYKWIHSPLIIFLFIITTNGCNNRVCHTGPWWLPPEFGTKPDPYASLTHRRLLAEGRTQNRQLYENISLILSWYAVIPPLVMVINEPPTGLVPVVYASDLTPHLGSYTESSADQFDFTAGGDSVELNYLNGVHVKLTSLSYDPQGRLIDFDLVATSNNGVLTPSTAAVTMNLHEQRLNVRETIHPAQHIGVILKGNIRFNYKGSESTYKIERALGAYQEQAYINSLLQGERFYILNTNTNKYWNIERSMTFMPSDINDLWVAENIEDRYTDHAVKYQAALKLEDDSTSAGQANFIETGGYSCYAGQDLATLSGGPYNCKLSTPVDPGAGVPIQLNFPDDGIIDVFPGTYFNCANISIADPTQ